MNNEIKKGLPENAQKVFSGVLFDVYQWQQEMFDGTTETFEKIAGPESVSVVAITETNQIIITDQEQPAREPFISLPGGRREKGESIQKAIQRELQEETGYVSENWKLWETHRISAKIMWPIHVFVAYGCKQISEGNPEVAGEKIAVKMATFDEFLMLSDDETFRDIYLRPYLYKCRLDETEREKFRQLLFGT